MADGAQAPQNPLGIRAVDAEQALLGALLLNGDAIRSAPGLRPEHFYDPVHADIFRAILSLIAEGAPVSLFALRPRFEAHAGMAELGGTPYLARLAGAATTIASIPQAAKVVRDAYLRRQVIDAAARAQEAAQDVAAKPVAGVIAALEAEIIGLADATDADDGAAARPIVAAVAEAMESVWPAYHGEAEAAGIPTGLPSLDGIIGGWKGGRLAILAGRPGMGKSAVAVHFALAAARAGHGTLFFSLEMPSREVALRAVAAESWALRRGVPYDRIGRGDMDEAEAETVAHAAAAFEHMPLRITGPRASDLGSIAAEARRSQAAFEARGLKLGLVIVDYLGRVTPPRRRDSKVHEIGDVTSALKALSLSLDVPVIVLCQLSRAVELRDDKRPQLSDLRDSGEIEQDADVVIFAYRHEYYLARQRARKGHEIEHAEELEAARNRFDLIVAKNRQGRIGEADVWADMGLNAFAEWTA